LGFNGESVLKKLADATGGDVIRVGNARETAAAFDRIAEELRTQYLLGYTPTNTKRDGSYRKIELRAKHGGYKVQTRRGYYASSN
jgi:VWFA-related protein